MWFTRVSIAHPVFATMMMLAFVVLGMFVYSFLVIRHRGRLEEPSHLTPLQRIWRGL